jgi:hypothetical protein
MRPIFRQELFLDRPSCLPLLGQELSALDAGGQSRRRTRIARLYLGTKGPDWVGQTFW